MRICAIAVNDPLDEKTWSRVPMQVTSRFNNMDDVELCTYAWKKDLRHWYQELYIHTLGHLMYSGYTIRDPYVYKKNCEILRKKLSNYQTDNLLFFAEPCLDREISRRYKCFAYIDAVMRPVTEKMTRRRLRVDKYLTEYEKNDRECYEMLSGIFTMNEWSKRFLITHYGIDDNKVHNVGFGVNVKYYEGEKSDSKDILIVLRKGTEKYKGLDLLLEAFKIAQKSINDLRLLVVGTKYKEYPGVQYYYNQSREVTIDLFKKANLYAMPALCEVNGITYIEALANKTPILGLDRFALPEFSGYGKYGFIAKEASAEAVSKEIIYAFSDIERLKEMGVKGQKFVRGRYNWDNVVDKMKKIIENNNI